MNFFMLTWSYRMDSLGEKAFKNMELLEKHQARLLKSLKFIGFEEGYMRFKVKEFNLPISKGKSCKHKVNK